MKSTIAGANGLKGKAALNNLQGKRLSGKEKKAAEILSVHKTLLERRMLVTSRE